MFRRKEENSADFTSENSIPGQPSGSTSGNENTQTTAAPSAPSHAIYQVAPRTANTNAETANATPAPRSGANYRPAPVTEFNRNLSPRQAQHTASNVSEKSSSKSPSRILTVGNDILLKGEIATCDRIIIEGRVEAKLSEVHTVEISSSGSFKGTAEVQDAEVSGVFEGDLIVRNRLVIYSTGEVRGNITYGEIEVERGGKLTGQIKTVSANEKPTLLDVLDKKSRKEAAEA